MIQDLILSTDLVSSSSIYYTYKSVGGLYQSPVTLEVVEFFSPTKEVLTVVVESSRDFFHLVNLYCLTWVPLFGSEC